MAELVENSFALSARLFKKDFSRARRGETVDEYLNFSYNGNQAALDYSIEYVDDKPYLVINYTEIPQRILLSEQELTFGTRTYLTCKCGCRTTALYLHKDIFACRKCHKLRYESTTINRTSRFGRLMYQQINAFKLIKKGEKISRIIYRSKYTKRFSRWLNFCSREGFFEYVLKAEKLMTEINKQSAIDLDDSIRF